MPLMGSLVQEMQVYFHLFKDMENRSREEVLSLAQDFKKAQPEWGFFQNKSNRKATVHLLKQEDYQAQMEDAPMLKLFAQSIGIETQQKHGFKFKLACLWKKELEKSTPHIQTVVHHPIHRL